MHQCRCICVYATYAQRQVVNIMLFSILQEITSTHELVEYSEEYTQRSLSSSWAAVNEHDIEEEKFELYSQESRTEFGSS